MRTCTRCISPLSICDRGNARAPRAVHGNIAATRDSVQNFNFQWSSEWDPRELPGEGGVLLGQAKAENSRLKCSIFRPWRWVFIVCRLCMTDDAVLRKQLPPWYQFERSIMHCRHPACFAVHSCHSMPRPRQEAIRPLLQQLPLKGPISSPLPLLFPHPLTPRLYFSLTPPHLPSPLTVPLPLPPPSSFPSPTPPLPYQEAPYSPLASEMNR